MLIYLFACLFITLFVTLSFVLTDTLFHSHRLLPTVMVVADIYLFSEIVSHLSGQSELLAFVKALLLLQMLYLIMCHVLDFLFTESSRLFKIIVYLLLTIVNFISIVFYYSDSDYRILYWCGVISLALSIIVIMAYWSIRHYSYRQELKASLPIHVAVLLPIFALLLSGLSFIPQSVLMPGAIVTSCIIFFLLLKSDLLCDSYVVLKENLFNASENPKFLFDANCYYLEANASARTVFKEEIEKLESGRQSERQIKQLLQVSSSAKSPMEFEQNGRFYQCILTPVYTQRRLKGYILSFTDISREKKQTRLMTDLKQTAEQQALTKSHFMATISHDLRSPLHAIIGMSDILIGRPDISSENLNYITRIKQAGSTLLRLVNDILTYSKLEAGKRVPARKEYSLDDMLEELSVINVVNLKDKPVEYTAEITTEHPARLLGDELGVHEILQNILSNAVKFTQKGNIHCSISTEVQKNGVLIHCKVSDTGPGMTPEQTKRIFNEYTSYAAMQSQEGSGLGMNIVKQLLDSLGGSISVISDGHSGTTMDFVFFQEAVTSEKKPPVQFKKEGLLEDHTLTPSVVVPTWTYPNARILLADDMKINHTIFKNLVEPWGVALDMVDSGEKAIEAVKKQSYQLIFLDLLMPGLKGNEAAQIIRTICDTPMVLFSANLEEDMASEFKDCGFAGYMQKPFTLHTLKRILESLIPASYRNVKGDAFNTFNDIPQRSTASRRTLESFVNEVSPMVKMLPIWAETDVNMFRTKVHGIKGASRQLNFVPLSEQAEILEMAAKTANLQFIESHLEEFLHLLEETLNTVKGNLFKENADYSIAKPTMPANELFYQLKDGFDEFNISRIETSLSALQGLREKGVLTAEQVTLLENASQACNDFDYQRGSELLSFLEIFE